MNASRPPTTPRAAAPAATASSSGRSLERVLELGCLGMLYAVPLTLTWTVAGVHIAMGIAAAFGLALGLLCRRWPLARTPADAAFVATGSPSGHRRRWHRFSGLHSLEAGHSFTSIRCDRHAGQLCQHREYVHRPVHERRRQ